MNTRKEQSARSETVDLSKIEKILEKYKNARGAVIPILQMVQAEYGYLPEPIVDLIAERLHISTHEIVGVATFYAQFHLKPRGQHIIKMCCGTACHVKGAKKVLEKLSQTLEVSTGMTTKDNVFTLEEVACLGACSLAPVMMVDEDIHGKLAPDTVATVIKEIKESGFPK
ncbi:MAG: NADH-quinone oxidoreductase subunit NuoE [Candidatus Brocadia sp. AMX2]|uniref:NADH dehydrogenase I subunit E n=1 Tax=Candidatus Brocadia sinica JPN1 TaxID=1197129 RepID=A0ABQ0JVR3_9BACT|nr:MULTISPECIES: NADH-quinone oxidoreductase subunit NuoE [Brocadia]KXK32871.1 MAG: NADH dehydrogenase I subunit E [Candidatus Brocadia sinica]MBC6933837.1 NADH-quinone oxidoreductase subunit NuoE [Candidatus Brocadia sp.]MBL1167858.1 NADH-quinone oxidoreductase subunit NuoE [Candidatus Brocadia sp. AMX1]NOG41576.1 NADH-quinone oxidoreductase subunit NuoE [Planctomycetota bacterium]KAA0241543.1 MAG: NADH-quinone oxidoreductase subunit NuoE [Candidatus Brocadia sp. AMX2]